MENGYKLAGHKRALRREAYRVLDTRTCAALHRFLAGWWREGGAEAYAAEVVERVQDDQLHAASTHRQYGSPDRRAETIAEQNEVTAAARSTKLST